MNLPPIPVPRQGEVWMCDFGGYVVPEMVKRRRVAILSPRNSAGLFLVAPVSALRPEPVTAVHVFIPRSSYACFGNVDVWVKADMIAHVRRDRLDRVRINGRYIRSVQLSADHLVAVQQATLHALGFGRLAAQV
jgi:uncharacterized protein YifN (PemK superfamily)